jgi:FKBP-type peptidyl-prolyl cis-trans isomerase
MPRLLRTRTHHRARAATVRAWGRIGLIFAAGLVAGFGCTNQAECTKEPVTSSSGLTYRDITCGDGTEAARGNSVEVTYKLSVDGNVIETTDDHGGSYNFRIGAAQALRGLEDGVVGMKEGGVRELVVPPELGYGDDGYPLDIPPHAELTFEVELLDVVDSGD